LLIVLTYFPTNIPFNYSYIWNKVYSFCVIARHGEMERHSSPTACKDTFSRADVQEAIDITYYAAGEGRRLFGETTPSELPDKFCMT
jgi:hypothetical protein